MGNEKSTVANKNSSTSKIEQTSTVSKDVEARRRTNIKMIQNVLLVWLDSNIDNNNKNCQNTITQLRCVVNEINMFANSEECLQFLENITDYKACMIISGSLGKYIMPHVHNMSQVDSVFIFCDNKHSHEQWVQEWSKIKGIFTDITPICNALKQIVQQCEQNSIAMSFMETTDDMSNKKLDQLESSFMYTQILKEILLTIQFEEQDFQQFLNYCREALAGNPSELQNVSKIEQEYRKQTPIWWYTYECFLYPMLNRALRTLDANLIITLGFFIKDLHLHIEQLYKEQFNSDDSNTSVTVYRGQGLAKEAFEKMMQTQGGLLSFNCFLSTSKKRDVSLSFAKCAAANPNLIGILFVMNTNPFHSTTPFAAIGDYSYFGNQEEEVLFSMHTVFRIQNITPLDENHRLFQVDLTLTNDNDPDLHVLTDRIRKETYAHASGWNRLGKVLLKMGQAKKAEEVYQILLEQATTKKEKAAHYSQLAWAKQQQGEYKEAIIYLEKALEIRQQSLPPNHLDLASTYGNLGVVYKNMGEYSKALSSYEKALAIQQKTNPPNYLDLAATYNNIGEVYRNMAEYSKALASHEKALTIRRQSLPPNHPSLAMSYNNIGNVYKRMGEYSKALSCYEKSLAIREQSLPPNHPELASSYGNIGLLCEEMGNYSKAHSFLERACEIAQNSLPSNHVIRIQHENHLDRIKKKV